MASSTAQFLCDTIVVDSSFFRTKKPQGGSGTKLLLKLTLSMASNSKVLLQLKKLSVPSSWTHLDSKEKHWEAFVLGTVRVELLHSS
jgi:hypothetical protein